MKIHITRIKAFVLVMAGLVLFSAAGAHATGAGSSTPQGETFITTMGDEAIGFLSDKSLSQQQKEERFKAILDRDFDMKTIGRFTMASYWKTLTPAQQDEFHTLFEKLIVAIYTQKLSNYQGEKFKVVGSRATGDNEFIVNSTIIPPSGKTVPVDWQVRSKDGSFRIIDVVIEGVSMAITKKSEFSSIIQRGGGNTEVLFDHLRAQKTGAAENKS